MSIDKALATTKVFKSITSAEKDAVRHKILMLSLRNMSNSEIAKHSYVKQYNLTVDDIKDILKSFDDDWKRDNQAVQDFSKTRELRKTELVEREAWQTFEKSKLGTTTVTRKTGGRDGDIEIVTTKNGQENLKALELVLECIKERNKMVGNHAPVKSEHSGSVELKSIQINYHAPLPSNDIIDVEFED
jgi:hypothetical protein